MAVAGFDGYLEPGLLVRGPAKNLWFWLLELPLLSDCCPCNGKGALVTEAVGDSVLSVLYESRKPFASKAGPVRADHTIFGLDKQGLSVEKPGTSILDGNDPGLLPMNRLASTGSMAGIADVDEKLHQLSKKYSSLMDKYRQLKGMKATPVRNQEVDSLLERIKEVYEETPDHRKPALPPELENKYDTTKGSFVKPEQIPESPDSVSPRSVFGARKKPPAIDVASTDDQESDYHHNDRYRHRSSRSPPSSSYSPTRRARYGSMDSNSTDYTGKTPTVHPSRARVSSESDVLNSPRVGRSRSVGEGKIERDTRRLPKPGPGSRRKDIQGLSSRADGGDSGYFGSEGSRKTAATSSAGGGKLGERSTSAAATAGHGSRGFPSRRGTTGTSVGTMGTAFGSPRSREDGDEDSDVSSSGSASSVIERKMERRRAKAEEGRGTAALDGSSRGGPISKGQGDRARSRSRSRGKQPVLTEGDRSSSLNSGELASPRSEKLKSLSDEVERLKATLSNPPQQITQHQQPPQVLVQGQPQTLVTASTGVPTVIPPHQQPQLGITPQTIAPTTPAVNFADPAAVAMGTAAAVNGYPVYPQDPITGALPPQAMAGYDYYNDYNNGLHYGQMPPDPRDYYDPEYDDYEEADYEPEIYRDRRRSLERGDRYRGQHQSGSRDRYDRDLDGYDSRESPRDYNDYDSRDRDFSDVRGHRYSNNRGRKASLPDNYYADSYGEKYEGDSRSRSSRGPHHHGNKYHNRNHFDDLLDEYDPSGRARSHERRRNKSHERYHSDPESPAHSPSRYSELRKYYIPKRWQHYGGARDHSGSRSPTGGHFSRRERYLSPNRQSRMSRPRGGPNGLPPPYPAAQRMAGATYPRPGYATYNTNATAPHLMNANTGVVQPSTAYNSGVINPQQTGYQSTYTTPSGMSSNVNNNIAGTNLIPVGTQQQMTACPTCGGKSSHSHSNFVFQPQPVNSAAATNNSNTQNGLVPVQLVPVGSAGQQASGKVRYYVREYGGESASDMNGRGTVVQKKSRHVVKTLVLSGESDDDEDMDESLDKALKTAKKLKKMSFRMKQTLHDEINKSIQDGSFLMT